MGDLKSTSRNFLASELETKKEAPRFEEASNIFYNCNYS